MNVAASNVSLEFKLGSVVDEQQIFSNQSQFDKVAKKCRLAPGDVLQLSGPSSLSCSKIYFIECLSWDGAKGLSVQALGDGLRKCLDLCRQQGCISVAFPVIGPGISLMIPQTEAIRVLKEKIIQFVSSQNHGTVSNIRIVIKEDYPDSEEFYHEVYRHFSLNQESQAIFKSVTGNLDEITITVPDGVKLQLAFGDISNETTDVVVNTTDFSNFNTDVCKAILAKAGPVVEQAESR
ncbi:protein mono-ADP-ribosyltransferase PARP14-like [Thalassophryne amazonica]|uniref:protein mono-ADP-ribosyltransferase PARP14-like n=1 Tax=Thalassophryne amazonica TaxID=390379 RepID=UPI001471AF84|nr:protein mono-ADP-ribosyltransferase PARP14-like [Thalassophryne amazonica]